MFFFTEMLLPCGCQQRKSAASYSDWNENLPPHQQRTSCWANPHLPELHSHLPYLFGGFLFGGICSGAVGKREQVELATIFHHKVNLTQRNYQV